MSHHCDLSRSLQLRYGALLYQQCVIEDLRYGAHFGVLPGAQNVAGVRECPGYSDRSGLLIDCRSAKRMLQLWA